MKLKFYQEICCDLCDDGIHVHFDCPVCNEDNVGTDIYGNLNEHIQKVGDSFSCENCNAEFSLVDGNCYDGNYTFNYDKFLHEKML